MTKEKVFNYPKEVKSTEEKIDYLGDQVKEFYGELLESEKTSTGRAHQLGRFLEELKGQLKKSGANFHDFLGEKFPYITVRTAQRYMELAKKIDLDSYPTIGTAGLVRLKKLMDVVGKRGSIVDLLNDNKIGLNFSIDDAKAVRKFKNEVDDLLNKSPKEKKGKGKKNSKKSEPSFESLSRRVSSFLDSLKALMENKVEIQNVEAKVLNQMINFTAEALEKLKKIQETTGSEPKE